MKTTFVVLAFVCILCGAPALGQSAPVLSNIPSPIQMTDHPMHAAEHDMRQEVSLLSSNSPYTYAQGEVPLAELGSPTYQVPLGEVARENRREHATAAKAIKVLEQ